MLINLIFFNVERFDQTETNLVLLFDCVFEDKSIK